MEVNSPPGSGHDERIPEHKGGDKIIGGPRNLIVIVLIKLS